MQEFDRVAGMKLFTLHKRRDVNYHGQRYQVIEKVKESDDWAELEDLRRKLNKCHTGVYFTISWKKARGE